MLKQRLTVGVIGAVFMIAVLFSNVTIISIVFSLIAVIGLSELYNATGIIKKQNRLCIFSYVFAILMFISLAIFENPSVVLGTFCFLYAFILLTYMIFNHETCDFQAICSLFLQTIYVAVFFAHIILMRKLAYGKYLIWFIFITAWLSDTMAYAVGLKFGRNKLIPSVSPKKTVEGALGGLLGSVLFNLIYAIVCTFAFDLQMNYFALIIMALVAGVVSQLGDLCASCIKREYNLKDYSNLLPGHGGIVDRFDSVLFVAPAIYYFVVIFPVIA